MYDVHTLLAFCHRHARWLRSYPHADPREADPLLHQINRLPLLADRLRCHAALRVV